METVAYLLRYTGQTVTDDFDSNDSLGGGKRLNEIVKIEEKLQWLFVAEKGNLPDFLQTKESRREWMTQFEGMIREHPESEEGGKLMK